MSIANKKSIVKCLSISSTKTKETRKQNKQKNKTCKNLTDSVILGGEYRLSQSTKLTKVTKKRTIKTLKTFEKKMSANGKTKDLTPKQSAFLNNYTNPKRKTFGNALQSALSAGFSREYAESIGTQAPEWLTDNLGTARRQRIIEKAEANLEEFMHSDDERIKSDMTKFALTRLRKEHYSDRTELTGKDGAPISQKEVTPEEFDELMSGYVARKSGI